MIHVPLFPSLLTKNKLCQQEGNLLRNTMEMLLDAGMTPLLHGDTVLDVGNQKCSIFSGDRILSKLTNDFNGVVGMEGYLVLVEGAINIE